MAVSYMFIHNLEVAKRYGEVFFKPMQNFTRGGVGDHFQAKLRAEA